MYKLNHSKIILDDDIIIIKPEKRSLIVAIAQGFIGVILFIVLSQFFNSLNYFVMFFLFISVLFFVVLSILGLIYSIWGSKAIINSNHKMIIWQQGLFGLGIGTDRIVKFRDIKFIEVNIDTDNQVNGHNFFLIEINVISNDNQKNNLISEFDKLAHLDILSESINNLASDIARLIRCAVRFQKS
ncbi:MAG: hypothetical protein P8J51_01665 [Dehalococcoidia bacterium]|nr:hypothetical protein [Dehalococcoidia bacterium]